MKSFEIGLGRRRAVGARTVKPLSTLAVLSWSIGLSLMMYLLLILPDHGMPLQLPSRVKIDRPKSCDQASVEVETTCDVWKVGEREGDAAPPCFSCSPKGLHEEDWTAVLTLRSPRPAICTYELIITDTPNGDISTRSPQYQHVNRIPIGDTTTYVLHGKPWRTYAVAPTWRLGEHTGFAGELILVGFYQQHGLNMRGGAIFRLIVHLAAALITLFALYHFRARRWMHTSSWQSVVLLSAAGGAIAGALLMLRPPDAGGYDEPLDALSIVVGIMLISSMIGVTGSFFAWSRQRLYHMSPAGQLLMVSLVLLFVVSLTIVLSAKWSAHSESAAITTLAYLCDHAGDIRLASSIALPLILYQESGPHSAETTELHARFLKLFSITAFCGLLTLVLSIAIREVLQVATPGLIYRGSYKPGGAVVLWIVSLFIIAGLSAALAAGRRPRQTRPPDKNLPGFAEDTELCSIPEISSSGRAMRSHTILFLAADPTGTNQRALGEEARAIQVELERSGYRDRFALETRWAAEPLDLLRELRRLKPTVVHFSGHGSPSPATTGNAGRMPRRDVNADSVPSDGEAPGGLFFQGAGGEAQVVTAEALHDAFRAAGSSVKLVVLSACYSDAQAEALCVHVDCVVGMRGTIGCDAARSFAVGFYGGLGAREPVAAAFHQGCAAISLDGLPDRDRPQLKVRDSIDANKLILGLG